MNILRVFGQESDAYQKIKMITGHVQINPIAYAVACLKHAENFRRINFVCSERLYGLLHRLHVPVRHRRFPQHELVQAYPNLRLPRGCLLLKIFETIVDSAGSNKGLVRRCYCAKFHRCCTFEIMYFINSWACSFL